MLTHFKKKILNDAESTVAVVFPAADSFALCYFVLRLNQLDGRRGHVTLD